MTTWATLRSNVRIMLKDTLKPYKWGDDELLLYADHAIRQYSAIFPHMDSATPTATGTAGVYVVDDDWEIERVSHTTTAGYEEFLEELERQPGLAMHYWARGWWSEGSTLYIFPTSLESIEVYYYTSHTIPESDDDELTVSDDDLCLIEWDILATAMDRDVAQSALLDRWGERRRDDNPIIIPGSLWRSKWRDGVSQRLMGRRIRWYVKGRDRTARDSRWTENV